jgi:hypothetical protein
MIIRLALVAVLIMAPAFVHAETPSESIERFLLQVATPESDAAFDRLFAGSGFAELKPQELLTLKGQTKMAMGLYGTPIGLEKVLEEDLSPSLKRIVYLQKFEKYPVAWEFYFYKPKDKWVINVLNFKDQIAPLVESKR